MIKIFYKQPMNIIKYILINEDLAGKFKEECFGINKYHFIAVSSGNIELIRLLEQQGANYDNGLYDALISRNPDLIDWILENYQHEKISSLTKSNIRAIIFCLENNICTNYYNLYEFYYKCKFKSVLEFFATYKLNLIHEEPKSYSNDSDEEKSIVSHALSNKRFDYFNIFYELGLRYPAETFRHPISYVIEAKNYDLDFYEKIYQYPLRNPSTKFRLIKNDVKEILSNMELLKFFYQRNIFFC